MSSEVTIDELLDSLQDGELLLLPNSSAARELRAAYDARQRKRGLAAWEPAKALAWQQWTNSLYSDLIVSGSETRLLLNAAQEQSVWREVINDDLPPDTLGSPDSLAELACSAFRLAADWNITARLRESASSDDTRTFAKWAGEFTRRCSKQNCLPAALLSQALVQHISSGTLSPPSALRLLGFNRITPAQQSLLDSLQAHVTVVKQLTSAIDHTTLHATVLADSPREELQLATRWIRNALEAAPDDKPLRIAVLNPNLSKERAEMESIFREILAPELQSVDTDLSSTPWEFPSGAPLTSFAMVADALDIVRWTAAPLPQQRITTLLLSPYLGPDRDTAAKLDALIRRKEKFLRPELTLEVFNALLAKYDSPVAWSRNLAIEVARSADLAKPQSYAEWMRIFRTLIQSTGWPASNTRTLNAVEFEVTRAWDSVLDLISTLDFSGRRVSFETALEALQMQAQVAKFTPPSNGAAVQVMAPEDAEGSIFDAVLFLHATDESWPAPQGTHPLLSWQLQNSLGMPGTDPAGATARSRDFTTGLLNSIGTVLFFSAKEDDNGHLRPSPLLNELNLPAIDVVSLAPAVPAPSTIEYELFADDSKLPALPSSVVHGGARVLQLQAACGFRAFAEIRLNASEPSSADIGLDAKEGGTLVHGVLQMFWTKIATRDQLAQMSPSERSDLLSRCIDETLRMEQARPDSQWDAAYLSMMRKRLLQLLYPWLELELARSPFIVQATERKEEIDIGPLTLTVRIDRIDRAQEGSVLIDYKTGASAKPAQWNAPRPEEPQLPLYTLLLEPDEAKAIAFGKILAGEKLAWLGVQSEAGILPLKKTEDLAGRIQEWRVELTRLAYEFAEGHATVSPKQYPQTCVHCAQRLLCRIDPATLHRLIDEEEEDDSDG